jgi:hypothetical protein
MDLKELGCEDHDMVQWWTTVKTFGFIKGGDYLEKKKQSDYHLLNKNSAAWN